jgi:membrane-bound lytic murein transglycosylase C
MDGNALSALQVCLRRFSATRTRGMVLGASLLLAACSTEQLTEQALKVALSKDPKAMLTSMAENKVDNYRRDPMQLLNDFDRLRQQLAKLFGDVHDESEKKWGAEEAQTLPGPKKYVKYTQQYKNRIVVDYEKSTIRIEHIQEPRAANNVRNAVVVALLTPQDPKSADVFSDSDVVLDGQPFLQNLVLDQNKKAMVSRQDVERYADFLVANRLQNRRINVGGAKVDVVYVQIDMVGAVPEPELAAGGQPGKKPGSKPGTKPGPVDLRPDARADDRSDPNNYATADKIAPKFLTMVNRYADKTGVDAALIFAIIYQESRFNPNAVSSAEAYGMMQLVPKSGGLEAFRKARGESVKPTKEYLMDPESNIELGATYLGMLLFDYWTKNINNMPAREYCVISGYNTGPGNVSRAFTGSTGKLIEAQGKANGMSPDELFDYLRTNLPYAETRDYLLRVSSARRHYQQLFYAAK